MKDSESDIDISIGNQIRKRRHLLGLSQTDLANKVGVTFQQIQKYEKGQNKIMASRLFKLSKILNLNISYFFENVSQESNTLKEPEAEFVYDTSDITSLETKKLVKLYSKIGNDSTRKKLLSFLKTLSQEEIEEK
jgi:transcriptional regulator with XRE-family HTH domain